MKSAFASAAMAEGYARSRPPVHPEVIERVRTHLLPTGRIVQALDVGCGAGISTRPLTNLAERVLGIEPVEAMLPYAAQVAPGAQFAAGRAEALPVRSDSMDLITAAGALNYADLDAFFPEAGRVLHREGVLVVYDFSQGRSFPDSPALDEWFQEFRNRYPPPKGDARYLDPEVLATIHPEWRVASHENYAIALRLTPQFYVEYAMTETNVAVAIANSDGEAEIRAWCGETVMAAFAGLARDVIFRGYFACMKR